MNLILLDEFSLINSNIGLFYIIKFITEAILYLILGNIVFQTSLIFINIDKLKSFFKSDNDEDNNYIRKKFKIIGYSIMGLIVFFIIVLLLLPFIF